MPVTKTIVIESEPVAQPRPRVTRWGTFDPAKDKKNWARIQIANQVTEKLTCPIRIDILYALQVPKSTSKKKRVLMLNGEIKHVKRPDIDNYAKFTLDVLNDIAFVDDSQIYHLTAQKVYSEHPRTEITLKY